MRIQTGKKNSQQKQHSFFRKKGIKEQVIVWLLFLTASIAVVVSAAIIYTLVEGSIGFFFNPAVNIFEFFTGTKWAPNGNNPSFGLLPLLSGTLLVAGGALLIGAPLGIGAALYLSEFAGKKVRTVAKPVIEVLAGIPSIVYGFFALLVISPILQQYFGASYFNAASAIIVMAIMVLPIIVSISDDSMKAVPKHLREASMAMGATKWETSVKVVMPAASSGIIASLLLGLARALGETMVVVLAAGSIARLTLNPFQEVQTMTAYIAQVATGDIPPGVAVSAAFAVGLILFVITYIVNLIAGRVVLRIKRGGVTAKKQTWVTRYSKKIFTSFAVLWNHLLLRTHDKKISLKRRYLKGKIGKTTVATSLLIAVVFLVFLLTSVLEQGLPSINWNFLTSFPSATPSKAGIYPVILGSIYLVCLTLVFAVPMGVGAAIYLNEFAKDNRYTRFLRRIIQNLAGVPSIVFGLVGLAIFSRLFGFGPSLLAGSLTLAIMILPVIVVATEEALKSVPDSFREASRGLGATKWQTVRHHVLPHAVPGTLTGVILALSRAIGETAPILFIGSVFAKTAPNSILDGFLALPITIFYWTRQPKLQFHDLAASTIVVLLVILLSMNLVAIIIRQRSQAKRDW
ncbi:MAG TPA: phosphate ABC transporter permease PstA [Candidatus Thermoplasmatota archaeon]|nr:phosphate ABC transporter permease PstA [Candidatus Thermoplasmatota archaeon]